jgi:transcriptional regulator with XRE-family HTH domain
LVEVHALSSQIARNKATLFPHTFVKDEIAPIAQTVRMGKKPSREAANHLRAWREFRRLSQAALAERVGTADNVISTLESGDRRLSDKWLKKLAVALDTTPGYLLDYDPNDIDTELIRAAQEVARGNREQVLQILRTFKTGTNG